MTELKRYDCFHEDDKLCRPYCFKQKEDGEWVCFDDVRDWHSKEECWKSHDCARLAKENCWYSPEDWQKAEKQLKKRINLLTKYSEVTHIDRIIDEVFGEAVKK